MLYFSRKYSHVNTHVNVLLYVTWDNKEEKKWNMQQKHFPMRRAKLHQMTLPAIMREIGRAHV